MRNYERWHRVCSNVRRSGVIAAPLLHIQSPHANHDFVEGCRLLIARERDAGCGHGEAVAQFAAQLRRVIVQKHFPATPLPANEMCVVEIPYDVGFSMVFRYFRALPDGRETLVAEGEQEVVRIRRQAADVEPIPLLELLVNAVIPYMEPSC